MRHMLLPVLGVSNPLPMLSIRTPCQSVLRTYSEIYEIENRAVFIVLSPIFFIHILFPLIYMGNQDLCHQRTLPSTWERMLKGERRRFVEIGHLLHPFR